MFMISSNQTWPVFLVSFLFLSLSLCCVINLVFNRTNNSTVNFNKLTVSTFTKRASIRDWKERILLIYLLTAPKQKLFQQCVHKTLDSCSKTQPRLAQLCGASLNYQITSTFALILFLLFFFVLVLLLFLEIEVMSSKLFYGLLTSYYRQINHCWQILMEVNFFK